MSSGLNCEFIEFTPGNWYYVLEKWDAPREAFDWHEYASACGPFVSYEAATDYFCEHERNPGGWNPRKYDPAFQKNEILKELVNDAQRPEEDLSIGF